MAGGSGDEEVGSSGSSGSGSSFFCCFSPRRVRSAAQK